MSSRTKASVGVGLLLLSCLSLSVLALRISDDVRTNTISK